MKQIKILEQTSNKLVCQSQRNISSFIFGFMFMSLLGFILGVIPLSLIVFNFAFPTVETLSCKRIGRAQVNCELTQSTLVGLRKEKNPSISIGNVTEARFEDSSVVLLLQRDEVFLFNNNPDDATRINDFVENFESTSLTIKYNSRWHRFRGSFFSWMAFLLYLSVGLFAIKFSLYLAYHAILVEIYTFDKSLGKLIQQRRVLTVTKVKDYPLQDILGVRLEEKDDGEGVLYQVSLLLTGDIHLILIPFINYSDGKKERKSAEIISQFLNLPIAQ